MNECEDCGLLQLEPGSADAVPIDHRGPSWWEAGPARRGWLARCIRQFAIRQQARRIAGRVGQTGPVLDLSCADGSLASELRRRGLTVFAGDACAPALVPVQQERAIPAACFRLPHPCFRRKPFGAVLALHALEHVDDPERALKAIHRMLVPGGVLVLQVPNPDSWQAMLLGERWTGYDIPRHLLVPRASDIENLLEMCGFKILRRQHLSWWDDCTGLVTSLCPGLDPVLRQGRSISEGMGSAILKNALYGALALAALPLTLLEAASGAGASVLIEAKIEPSEPSS